MTCTAIITEDLTLAASTGFSKRWQWLIDDVPVDLSGWTGVARGRDKHTDGSMWFEATTANGQLALDADGNVEIEIPHTAPYASLAAARRGVYDVYLTSPDGTPTRFADGALRLVPRVVTP